jgi:hypothetical protein
MEKINFGFDVLLPVYNAETRFIELLIHSKSAPIAQKT